MENDSGRSLPAILSNRSRTSSDRLLNLRMCLTPLPCCAMDRMHAIIIFRVLVDCGNRELNPPLRSALDPMPRTCEPVFRPDFQSHIRISVKLDVVARCSPSRTFGDMGRDRSGRSLTGTTGRRSVLNFPVGVCGQVPPGPFACQCSELEFRTFSSSFHQDPGERFFHIGFPNFGKFLPSFCSFGIFACNPIRLCTNIH